MAFKVIGLVLVTLFSYTSGYGDCDDPFHIKKQTWSTSDSQRDIKNAYKIFPYLYDQNVLQFVEGKCAYSLKLEFPDTCFQLHAPTTYGRDPGLLTIDTFEQKVTQKWHETYASSGANPHHYDAFFDFNFAVWVESLDDYITQWTSDENKDDLYGEYIGIEWTYSLNNDLKITSPYYRNNQFYSLLMHSPSSSILYEFISFKKPSDHLYKNIQWIQSSMIRATFNSMNAPYPWNREDNAVIVPLRISRATTDIYAMYDWYVNVMESRVLHHSLDGIVDDLNGDHVVTKYAFFGVLETQIEILIVQRPTYYTFGAFSLSQYEALLLEGHDSIITTPYCGIDRWFDNHFGVTTWTVPGYLDRILSRIRQRQLKYRIYRETKEHTTPTAKQHLADLGLDQLYIFFIFEPSGQTIQLMGDFADSVLSNVPLWNQQWCEMPCPLGTVQGTVNTNHIYVDNGDELYRDGANAYIPHESDKVGMSLWWVLSIAICIASCVLVYLYRMKQPTKYSVDGSHGTDRTPLIQQ
eukprot:499466_1